MVVSPRHIPVMLNEVLRYLAPQDGEIYVDATFGNGGYSEAILSSKNCRVIAIDRDPSVLPRAEELKKKFGERFDFCAGTFGEFENIINESIDGVVFDIGVSSMQLDDDFRGFSFAKEGKLDMRMSMKGKSAGDIINTMAENELADLIYGYGEEKKSRQIAHRIVEYRKTKTIDTTTELAEIIYQIMPKRFGQIDPATRTFQAIRIAVNDELKELENGLSGALLRLKGEGRLVVVDFHSLEDRIVKNFLNTNTIRKVHQSKYRELCTDSEGKQFCFASKAIEPTVEECAANPRARSAKLRYAIRRKEQEK